MSERLEQMQWKLEQATRDDSPDDAIHWALYLAQEDIPDLLAVAVHVWERTEETGICVLCGRSNETHREECPMSPFMPDEEEE